MPIKSLGKEKIYASVDGEFVEIGRLTDFENVCDFVYRTILMYGRTGNRSRGKELRNHESERK